MSVGILRRETVTPQMAEELLSTDIAEAAVDKLGYRGLLRAKQAENTVAAIKAGLREKDIRPFTTASVNKYKRKKLREAEGFGQRVALFAVGLLFVAVTAGLGWLARATESQWLAFSIAIGSVIFCILAIVCMAGGLLNIGQQFEWNITPLHGYDKPVPEFVLQTALDVQELSLNVGCHICELIPKKVGKERPESIWHDPFLVLQLPNDTQLYVEVWNEPQYKQDREA